LAFCDRPAGTVAKVGTKSKKGRKLGNGEFTAEHARSLEQRIFCNHDNINRPIVLAEFLETSSWS